ncbi:MAG: MATE family efflux transporter [Paludibacteraceae bacterium]
MKNISAYIPYYKRNLKVAIPIVLTQLGGGLVQLADNIMVGHLGAVDLAAVAFANSIFVIGFVFAMGVTMGITPLVGQAFVQKNHTRVASLLHNGMLFCLLMGIALTLILVGCYFFIDAMGQELRVAALSKPYYLALVGSLLPFMLFCVCKQFLEGLGNTKVAMLITIIANVLNIVLNYLFIFGKFGFPQLGAFGAGVATLIARLLMPVMFFAVILRHEEWNRYFKGFSWHTLSKSGVVTVAKVGIPIGGHMLLECSAWALLAIIVGWLGAVPLAANQIANNVANISFMMVVGVSAATTIRVSHQLGVRDFPALRMAAQASVHLCLFLNALMAVLMIVFRYQIPWIFTTDKEVIEITAQLLVLAGLFQLSDGMQSVGAGILRGLTDVKKPVLYAFVTYICINIPLGYILAFPCGMGVAGVWVAFIISLTLAAVLYHRRCAFKIKQLEKQG